jgi:hypothetical protein
VKLVAAGAAVTAYECSMLVEMSGIMIICEAGGSCRSWQL